MKTFVYIVMVGDSDGGTGIAGVYSSQARAEVRLRQIEIGRKKWQNFLMTDGSKSYSKHTVHDACDTFWIRKELVQS